VHEALGIGKNGAAANMPLETLLGIATEMMADARKLGIKGLPDSVKED
jgi:hypothetical protein